MPTSKTRTAKGIHSPSSKVKPPSNKQSKKKHAIKQTFEEDTHVGSQSCRFDSKWAWYMHSVVDPFDKFTMSAIVGDCSYMSLLSDLSKRFC